jgi:peptidyl-prolyl cis-trans isomerase A (cyclophilin A)
MSKAWVGATIVLVVACGSRTPAPPSVAPEADLGAASPDAPGCVEVAARIGETTAAGLVTTDSDGTWGGFAGIVERVVRERCEQDHWTAAARRCMAATTSSQDDACERELTAEQRARVERAVGRAMGVSDPGPGSPHLPPPTPDPDPEVRPPVASDLAGYLHGIPGTGSLRADIHTSKGTIHCTLFERETPSTVANFVGLATGAKAWRDPVSGELRKGVPLYAGLVFYRVFPGIMIQTGDPQGTGGGWPGYIFDNENVEGLRHDTAGVLSMANSYAANGSLFQITAAPAPWLDAQHTIFGHCDDVAVVRELSEVERDDEDRPRTPIKLERVVITRRP